MGRHATRARELDRMLRRAIRRPPGRRQAGPVGVESYSIKKLEEFYGFTREADLRKAGAARRAVEFSLQTGDLDVLTPEVKELVGLYNEEDCVSALRLRDWLETLRPDIPRPPRKTGDESEELEQRSKDVQDAMDALLKGVPDDKAQRTKEQHARWLLAHMLEFHRREDKVTWWGFTCAPTDEDDLLESARCRGLSSEGPEERGRATDTRTAWTSKGARTTAVHQRREPRAYRLHRPRRAPRHQENAADDEEHPRGPSHSTSPQRHRRLLMSLAADVAKNDFTQVRRPRPAPRQLLA